MNTISNDKASFSDSNGRHRESAGNGAHTYVHNTAPQLRVIGNPGPL